MMRGKNRQTTRQANKYKKSTTTKIDTPGKKKNVEGTSRDKTYTHDK